MGGCAFWDAGCASGGAAVAQGQRQGHLRCGFRCKGDAKKMSGNGWLCDKVRILFWNWPKSSPFFHAGCASCGVLTGDCGASVGENRGVFGRFRSSFWRFSWAFWGGRSAVGLCSRRVGRGATKKGASDSTRAVGCTEKGDHGAEIRRKLALSSSASGCRSPRGRRGEAVFVARPWPTAVGRRGSGVPW